MRGLGTVDPITCQMIQCGLLSQAEAGTETLYECAAAGYAGVLPGTHPTCQNLRGDSGAPEDIGQAAPSETGGSATADGAPSAAGSQAPSGGAGASPDMGSNNGAQTQDVTGPSDQSGAAAEAPTLLGEQLLEWTEPAKRRAVSMLRDLEESIGVRIPSLPWWVWLLAAAALYALLERRR